MKNRILGIFLSLMLCLSIVPANVFAEAMSEEVQETKEFEEETSAVSEEADAVSELSEEVEIVSALSEEADAVSELSEEADAVSELSEENPADETQDKAILYLDENGEEQQCTDFQPLTAEMTLWTDGWYLVKGEVAVNSRIEVSGDVHLILADDCDFISNGGIHVNGENTLSIYAQSLDNAGGLTVENVPSWQMAGIGGNFYEDSGAITINGGKLSVRASAIAIGAGYTPHHVTKGYVVINGGTVDAYGEAPGIGGGNGSYVLLSPKKGHIMTVRAEEGIRIAGSPITAEEDILSKLSGHCEVHIGTVPDRYYDINVSADVHGTSEADLKKAVEGEMVRLSAKADKYYHLKEWVSEEVTVDENGTFIMPAKDVTVQAVFEHDPGIMYLDESGKEQYCSEYTRLNADMTTLTDGWYLAEGDIRINSRIEVSGDVHLILGDACSLKTSEGIHVGNGNNLTVYAQSMDKAGTMSIEMKTPLNDALIGGNEAEDSGIITFNGGNISVKRVYSGFGVAAAAMIGGGKYGSGYIIINGGSISAEGQNEGAAIGSGFYSYSKSGSGKYGVVTINGGTVNVSLEGNSAAIGGGKGYGCEVTINGGDVTAENTYDGKGIGGDGDINLVTINGGTVKASSYKGEAIGITDGFVRVIPKSGTGIEVRIEGGKEADGSPFVDETDIKETLSGHKEVSIKSVIPKGCIYIDETGRKQHCTSFKEITSDMTAWNSGWYLVKGEVAVNSRIEVSGDVHLILADDCDFISNGGIHVNGENTLSIYAQSLDNAGGLTVKNVPSWQMAGIGGNVYEDSGVITINGGKLSVRANAIAIGAGYTPHHVTKGYVVINGGAVDAYGEAPGIGGGNGSYVLLSPKKGHVMTVRAEEGIRIADSPITAEEDILSKLSGHCEVHIGTVPDRYYDINASADVHGTSEADLKKAVEGEIVRLSAKADKYYHLKEWVSEEVTVDENGTFIMPAKDVTVQAVFEHDPDIMYLDESGEEQYCSEYTRLNADMTTLTDGWYLAAGDIKMNTRVEIVGDVHIILTDGCLFTVNDGIHVGVKNKLTVYGQSTDNAGKLSAVTNELLYNAVIGGNELEDSGIITINGGNIYAERQRSGFGVPGAAVIGGGDRGGSGFVVINGGTVVVKGINSEQGAGIGSAYDGGAKWGIKGTGSVTINGGTVDVEVHGSASGIGCGVRTDCTVAINGGTVRTTGRYDAAGIRGTSVAITGGDITAKAENADGIGIASDGKVTVNPVAGPAIQVKTKGGNEVSGSPFTTETDITKVIENQKEVYITTVDPYPCFRLTVLAGENGTAYTDAPKKLYAGKTVTLFAEADTNWHLCMWESDEVTVKNDGTFIMPEKDVTVKAIFEQGGPVSYLDENGEKRSCDAYRKLTSDMTVWNEGWYYAEGGISILSRAEVNGSVHLILADGCDLTVNEGIRVSGENSLSIYAQSKDKAGSLIADSDISRLWRFAGIGGNPQESGGLITINGGNVTSKARFSAFGCGQYGVNTLKGYVIVNGGRLDAYSSGRFTFEGWKDSFVLVSPKKGSLIAVEDGNGSKIEGSPFKNETNVVETARKSQELHIYEINSGSDYEPVNYTITSGENSQWSKGSKADLTVTSDAPFDKFESVKVDGNVIAESNYKAEEGSTRITLFAKYLETLTEETHDIEIVSTDGSASTSFTVKAKTNPSGPKSPGTGDNNEILPWLILSAAAAAVMTGTVLYGRKKRKGNS